MVKRLSDKIKKEIVRIQLDKIRKSKQLSFFNYLETEKLLEEGIDEYHETLEKSERKQKNLIDKEISDYKSLIKNIVKYLGTKGREVNPNELKDEDLLEVYRDKKEFQKIPYVGKKKVHDLEQYLIGKRLVVSDPVDVDLLYRLRNQTSGISLLNRVAYYLESQGEGNLNSSQISEKDFIMVYKERKKFIETKGVGKTKFNLIEDYLKAKNYI